MPYACRNASGFTLIETAIVLVIIGLIVGAVLKGSTMIQQARTKKVIIQMDNIRAAVWTFYDRYSQYPGDENLANVPSGETGNDGDSDGLVEEGDESQTLWSDLAAAKMINGDYATSVPRNAFGGTVNLYYFAEQGAAIRSPAHYFVLTNIPWDAALEIDAKLDDGAAATGGIRTNNQAYAESSGVVTLYVPFD